MKCKYLLVALLALASCTKEATVEKELPELPSEAIEKSMVNYRICTERGTKLGFTETIPYESKINNLQVLIFDTDTKVINYYKKYEGSTLDPEDMSDGAELYCGNKMLYALANGPSLVSVTSLTQLEAMTYGMKEYNSESGMIMVAEEDFSLTNDGAELYPKLKRMVCRIYLNTVDNELPEVYSTINIKKVFLGNVSSKIGYAGDYVSAGTSAPYINPDGVLDSPVYSMTCKDINKNCVIGTTLSCGTALYCYRNPLNSSSTGTFISVLAGIDGEDYYYTIYLDPLDQKMNMASDVCLHIQGLGSKDPAEVVEKGYTSYEVEVKEWVYAATYTEFI